MPEQIDQLAAIKQQLDNEETTLPVTVRTFLGWFGTYRRGWWVVQRISESLDSYGIETQPNFRHAYIDSEITFRKKELQAVDPVNLPIDTFTGPDNVTPTQDEDSEREVKAYGDPTYRIGKLEAANKAPVIVNPDSDLSEAVTKMLTHDYSQLPVQQSANRGLKGVISWRSIGIKFSAGKYLTKVRDLMEPSYQLISAETSIFKAIPIIIEHDYVLIENEKKEITGIITASDLSLQFKQLSEPFLLVGEIENHIRVILSKLPAESLRQAKDIKDTERKIEDVSDLTFGEYIWLFQNPKIWEQLSLHIDRKTFCEYLEEVRVIRNEIMHFDPDPDSKTADVLRDVARLLQTIIAI